MRRVDVLLVDVRTQRNLTVVAAIVALGAIAAGLLVDTGQA
jgi:hypothetical protein